MDISNMGAKIVIILYVLYMKGLIIINTGVNSLGFFMSLTKIDITIYKLCILWLR